MALKPLAEPPDMMLVVAPLETIAPGDEQALKLDLILIASLRRRQRHREKPARLEGTGGCDRCLDSALPVSIEWEISYSLRGV